MGEKHEFKIGDTVLLKVGRNEVQVKILKPMAGGNAFMVKSLASGRDFIMPGSRLNVPTVSIEPASEVSGSNPARQPFFRVSEVSEFTLTFRVDAVELFTV